MRLAAGRGLASGSSEEVGAGSRGGGAAVGSACGSGSATTTGVMGSACGSGTAGTLGSDAGATASPGPRSDDSSASVSSMSLHASHTKVRPSAMKPSGEPDADLRNMCVRGRRNEQS